MKEEKSKIVNSPSEENDPVMNNSKVKLTNQNQTKSDEKPVSNTGHHQHQHQHQHHNQQPQQQNRDHLDASSIEEIIAEFQVG